MVTIEDQGLSYVQYKADGVASNFMLIFPYLRQEHILVFQDGVLTTDWTWLNASEIHMTVTPVADTLITLKRQTEQNERLVDFQDGGQLSAKVLDLDSNQMFYLSQEAIDTTNFNLAINSSDSTIDAQNNKIINLAEGTSGTDAVNKNQLDAVEAKADAAVVTADAAAVTANAIASTANDALAASATATATADEALSTANAIAATADQAALDAAAAVLAANQAVSDAATAQATADQAILDAATAQAAAVAAESTGDDAQSSANAAQSDIDAHALATVAHGATGEVVGTTNIQTLTNKTLSGASIESPVRSDAKQDTKANLDTYALTASNGQLCFGTDTKAMYQVIDGVLRPVGGSSGGLDTIFQLVGDESISDWSTGDNAVFLGAGALSGTFVKNTTAPMQGLADYMYTQAAGSLNDYLAAPSQLVDPRFRGKAVTLVMNTMYDGANNDIEVIFYDATNSAIIPSSVFIQASTDVQTFKTNIVIPLTCAQIRIGFQTRVLNSGKIFRFDSVQMTSDTTVMASITNVTDWTDYTPTGSWNTNTSYVGKYRRVGDTMEVHSSVNLTGAPNAATLIINIPTGYVIDTNKQTNTGLTSVDGVGQGFKGGTGYIFSAYRANTTGVQVSYISNGTTSAEGNVSNTAPVVWGNTDTINITFKVPIVGWTASNTNIVTAPDTFSTDTTALTYAGSATYTLATLANAPVGTVITFTYAINTNTRTQTTTAPSQIQNSSGVALFTRAYNAASTAAQPVAMAIQIGKGMKGISMIPYKNTGKDISGSLDLLVPTSTAEVGLFSKDYNETTGVLFLDAGACYNSTTTTKIIQFSDLTSQNNANIAISASKNPALTGLNISMTGARGINSSGLSIAASGVLTTFTFDATKTYEFGGVSINSGTGLISVRDAGLYQINLSAVFQSATYAAGNICYGAYTTSTGMAGSLGLGVATTAGTFQLGLNGCDTIYMPANSSLTVSLANSKSTATPLAANTSNNFVSLTKLSVG